MARDQIAGPDDGPEPPFPIRISGKVVKGFGRGSRELGIPTANIPVSGLEVGGIKIDSGIYFGWAGLLTAKPTDDASAAAIPPAQVYPMVMSVGWNPFYKNEVRSIEVHIIHKFVDDFYDAAMNLVVSGYIRPELDYEGVDKLIEDIQTDIKVTERSLNRSTYAAGANDPFLFDFKWASESFSQNT